jgi:phosphohistidine phosphatase
MELLIVRHALADDWATFAATGQDDLLRPLTERGRKRMGQVARAIRQLVPVIDAIAVSPALRATQTAEILANVYQGLGLIQVPALAPGARPQTIAQWLARQPDAATLALVGHEPDLSGLIAWLTAASPQGFLRLGKGAVCLLECDAPAEAGCCELQWLMQPRQLCLLAD